MKNSLKLPPIPSNPDEDDIRAYAFHLYQQGGCVPGHDLENWFEATACLKANIPAQQSRIRLHSQTGDAGHADLVLGTSRRDSLL